MQQLFNDKWMFSLHSPDAKIDNAYDKKTLWSAVDIPHDWLIYDTKNLYNPSCGFYKKLFDVKDFDEAKERLFIRFDGVQTETEVYLNGQLVGQWKYGYTAFEFELTDALYCDGQDNELLVLVKFPSRCSRWYTGAGIYRDVFLHRKNKPSFKSDGIYISTVNQNGTWEALVDAEVSAEADCGVIRHTLYAVDGTIAAVAEGGTSQLVEFESPALWDINSPNLYTLKSELLVDGEVTDTEENRFGFRTIDFLPDSGFWLNGRNLKLQGVCQHHDLGCLGAAYNRSAQKRQLTILKTMGTNAVRTSHNMPAKDFMHLADEMGILVLSEMLDMWKRPKNPNDYAQYFDEWHEKDAASWVRRDRNHPSLIMWSIGNEIYDTHADEKGIELTHLLKNCVEKHDPRKNAPVTLCSNFIPWENTQKCADVIKLIGYNYAERCYNEHHAAHPDWIIFGSETASTVQSRGVYHFPLSQSVLSDDDGQCSSLGNSSTSWGARSSERAIINDRDAAFSAGQFLWSGTDYIGEPTPYHSKCSFLGQADTAGFEKDSYYIYQSAWTDYKAAPMVHIFPYWDFSEGQLIDVRVCSNAPTVELFFNDKSLGKTAIDHQHGEKLIADYSLTYTKGTLKAACYDENGEIIATQVRSSFSDAHSLIIKSDVQEITFCDMAFLVISAEDIDGNPVENANNRVFIEVEGAGRLVGLDNGNSADYDDYKGSSMKMFSGKLLAAIAANPEGGTIKVTARSQKLKTAEYTITAQAVSADSRYANGHSTALTANFQSAPCDEIPVRKIELVRQGGALLESKEQTVTVEARIHPANATFKDVEWRATNRGGITTSLAVLTTDGNKATLSAAGDGEIILRCGTKNGGKQIALYSQLEFTAKGLGNAYINPYDFVSGGLYNASNAELTNGNDRGVATLRGEVSHVGFRGVDFGEYGSDEVTLPLFPLDSGVFDFEIWQGMPEEGNAEKLCTVTYDRGSKWNTYIEQTFKLPRVLTGVQTICFVFSTKVHIQGFVFKRPQPAFSKIRAVTCKNIYGDNFSVTENAVENIGNNVTLQFGEMDFGQQGASKLQIKGCSHTAQNTIHIKLQGEAEDHTDIVEFTKSDGSEVREFEVKFAKGLRSVSFVFLPGSNFDFEWFRFVG